MFPGDIYELQGIYKGKMDVGTIFWRDFGRPPRLLKRFYRLLQQAYRHGKPA